NPGVLLYGSSGNGTTFHLSTELLQLMTGTRMVHVPYKAVQTAMTDLIAGRLHFMFNSVSSIEPHVKAGRLRGLAVTSSKRTVTFPELPTVSEAGVPGYELVGGTPAQFAAHVRKESAKWADVIKRAGVKAD